MVVITPSVQVGAVVEHFSWGWSLIKNQYLQSANSTCFEVVTGLWWLVGFQFWIMFSVKSFFSVGLEGNLTPTSSGFFTWARESRTTHQLLLFLFHAFSIIYGNMTFSWFGAAWVGSYKNSSHPNWAEQKSTTQSNFRFFFDIPIFFNNKKPRDPKDSPALKR